MDKINENTDFEYNDDILAYLSREEPQKILNYLESNLQT